jgi:hypothetical protein
MKTDVEKVAKIVTERTGYAAVHNDMKPHEEQVKSKQSCCWHTPIVVDGFEIACCVPSARSKGDARTAFFTFKKV